MQLPIDDRHNYYKNYLETQIAIMMGGRIAEEMFLKQMSTGAGNDIERATELARKMVCEWGMSELGPLTFGKKEEQIFLGREIAQHRDYSEATAIKIDEEVTQDGQHRLQHGQDDPGRQSRRRWKNRAGSDRARSAGCRRDQAAGRWQNLPPIPLPAKPDDGVQHVIKPNLEPGRAKGGERPATA